jgi:cob(I)alamin adenosyltransferase
MSIKVITGNGKGKTTSALGMALIALGEGKKAAVVQFLKGNSYAGELFSAQRVGLRVFQFGWGCPWSSMIRSGQMKCNSCGECFRQNRDPKYSFANDALKFARRLVEEHQCNLLVLDEVSHALRRGLIDREEFSNLLLPNREKVDFVLTGRQLPEDIAALADEVYELNEIRHPLSAGIPSRRGIEY